MKEWILLDNQSNVSIFSNPNFVYNHTTVDQGLRLATNGGILETNKQAKVPGFGQVWFDKNAITNIFSFAEMEDQYQITYDSSKEKAFIVHMPDKQIKFRRSDNGLYYCNVDYAIKDNQVVKPSGKKVTFKQNMVQTLDENKKFYTNRQIERAKVARELYQALGTPSVRDFKNIIRMNMINVDSSELKNFMLKNIEQLIKNM